MRVKLQKIENYDKSKDKDFGKIKYLDLGYDVTLNETITFKWNKRWQVIKIINNN